MEGEGIAGAAHAALDLIADQQRVVVRGQLAGQPGELGRNLDDAALSQDGFEDDACGLFPHRRFQRAEIVGGDEANSRYHRLEGFAILGLAGYGDRAQRAPSEGVVQRHDLGLAAAAGPAVALGDLQGRFDGFRTAVAEEGAL